MDHATSTHDYPTRTHHPRVRRLAGTIAAAAAIATLAPSATASAVEASVYNDSCWQHEDFKLGPLRIGRAEGDCPQDAGSYYRGRGVPSRWSLGVLYLPNGDMYSASVDNVFNLPPRDIPIPHL